MGLFIDWYSTSLQLVGFVDLDYTNDFDTQRLTDEHILFIRREPVSWLTKKQKTIVISTMKAKYMVVS